MAYTKGSDQRLGPGIGKMFFILFCVTLGPLIIRYLLTALFSSSTVIPPAEDVLKSASSPAALARRIAQAVSIGRSQLAEHGRQELIAQIVVPTMAGLIVLLNIVLWVHSRRSGKGAPTWPLVLFATILPFTVTLITLHDTGLGSFAFVELLSNDNTEPHAVSPHQQVTVGFDSVPPVNSIETRHHFQSLRVSKLTAATASGSSIELTPEVLRESGESPDNWTSFSRATPEWRIRPSVTLMLPDNDALCNSVVSGELEATLESPGWSGNDVITRVTPITGSFRFWVSSRDEVDFAASVANLQAGGRSNGVTIGFLLSFLAMTVCLAIRGWGASGRSGKQSVNLRRERYGQRQIFKVMHGVSESLPGEMTVRRALERVRSSGIRTWLVTDERGVIGVTNLSRLEQELAEGADKKVSDLVDAMAFPHVHPDQVLDLALERMRANQIEILPVVNRGNVHKLEGIVTLRDVLDA